MSRHSALDRPAKAKQQVFVIDREASCSTYFAAKFNHVRALRRVRDELQVQNAELARRQVVEEKDRHQGRLVQQVRKASGFPPLPTPLPLPPQCDMDILALACALVATILYYGTLYGGFVYDDRYVSAPKFPATAAREDAPGCLQSPAPFITLCPNNRYKFASKPLISFSITFASIFSLSLWWLVLFLFFHVLGSVC